MSGHAIPSDSILRRHFTQHAASRGLPAPPEDSVLLRHYLQLLGSVAGEAGAQSSGSAPAAAAPRSTASAAPAVAAGPAQQPQGWFANLMSKLFGK